MHFNSTELCSQPSYWQVCSQENTELDLFYQQANTAAVNVSVSVVLSLCGLEHTKVPWITKEVQQKKNVWNRIFFSHSQLMNNGLLPPSSFLQCNFLYSFYLLIDKNLKERSVMYCHTINSRLQRAISNESTMRLGQWKINMKIIQEDTYAINNSLTTIRETCCTSYN